MSNNLSEKRNMLVQARSNVISTQNSLSVPNKINLFGGMQTRVQRIEDRNFRRSLKKQELNYGKQIENIDELINQSIIPKMEMNGNGFSEPIFSEPSFNVNIMPVPMRKQARFFRGGI